MSLWNCSTWRYRALLVWLSISVGLQFTHNRLVFILVLMTSHIAKTQINEWFNIVGCNCNCNDFLGRKINLSGISQAKRSRSGPNLVYVDTSRGDNVQRILDAIGPFWAKWGLGRVERSASFVCGKPDDLLGTSQRPISSKFGCTAERYCSLHIVVQWSGNFRGWVNFSLQRTVAELRCVKFVQFSDFRLFSPYKTLKNVNQVTSLCSPGVTSQNDSAFSTW